MSKQTIPQCLVEIANELDLDLSDFEPTDDEPVAWDELFAFMHHWLGQERHEAMQHFDDLENEVDEIEASMTEEASA